MEIEKLSDISEKDFLEHFLISNKPVIVTDAMKAWDMNRFTPLSLSENFGENKVQVYDHLFNLLTIESLNDYLGGNFGQDENMHGQITYIRWFTKFKNQDFFWSDAVFDQLKGAWRQPHFLPGHSLVMPFCPQDSTIDASATGFPFKGLFISAKGARTRLHRDPLNSNAVLCQVYGKKHVKFYHPKYRRYLMDQEEFLDPENPDIQKFPHYESIRSECQESDLGPGEILFIPRGWFHDVTTTQDSISVTWNFVHSSELEEFCGGLNTNVSANHMEVLQYFFSEHIAGEFSLKKIKELLRSTFEQEEILI